MVKALLILGGIVFGLMTLAFFVALAIHFMLLSTDRFNWLDGPKRAEPAPVQTQPAPD